MDEPIFVLLKLQEHVSNGSGNLKCHLKPVDMIEADKLILKAVLLC